MIFDIQSRHEGINRVKKIWSSPENIFEMPKRITLAASVADKITLAIASGFLLPSERVKELAIAEKIGTSRAPIREALNILKAQGILVKDANQGFRVASFNDKTILQILKARLSIEIIILEDAIKNWQEEDPDVLGLNASINEMHLAAVNDDAIASMEADLRFHKYIADASKNTIASTLWDAIARHVMIILSLNKFRPDDLHAVVTHHQKLRDIIIGQVQNGLHVEKLRFELEFHFLKVWRAQKSELWSSETRL